MSLIHKTNELINACDEAIDRFYKMRELDLEPDFFNEVKPYADEKREFLIAWREEVQQFIQQLGPKYMHMQQIDYAIDAMEQFFVQSFYKATSKKRFIQSIQSTKYTLSTLLRYLEEGEGT